MKIKLTKMELISALINGQNDEKKRNNSNSNNYNNKNTMVFK